MGGPILEQATAVVNDDLVPPLDEPRCEFEKKGLITAVSMRIASASQKRYAELAVVLWIPFE
jgi:hypothetical protein